MKIESIGVVGSGQMGGGIAITGAMSGLKTFVYDIAKEQIDLAKANHKNYLERGVKKEKWDSDFVSKTLKNLNYTSELDSLKSCELVVEAASENKQVKYKIFENLDQICPPTTILASNTSSISITELAAKTMRPDKVIGMHFMNPVPIMKLVEGIRGLETSDETFESICQVTKEMNKTLIQSDDMPGFVVNRILMPMINEAAYALLEGLASAKDIDQAMKLGCNFPMGPLELADFIGLDTCLSIMEVLHLGLGDSKYRPCPLLRKYVQAKRLGKKSKRGFYEY